MKRFVVIALLLFGSFSLFAQQWVLDFTIPDRLTGLLGGTVDSNGDAVMIGYYGTNRTFLYPWVAKVSANGEYEIANYIDAEYYGTYLLSIIQLRNGNYFSAGIAQDTVSGLGNWIFTMIIDKDLNIVLSRRYEKDSIADAVESGTLLLDNDGTVILSGAYRKRDANNVNNSRAYFYRFDEDANILGKRYVVGEEGSPEQYINQYECCQLLKEPLTGNIIVLGEGIGGWLSCLFYDDDFNFVREYQMKDGYLPYFLPAACSDYWYSDHELLLLGDKNDDVIDNWHLGLAKIDLDGCVEQCETVCHNDTMCENALFRKGMTSVNDSTMYGIYFSFKSMGWPDITGVFLFDKDLEVLGSKFFNDEEYIDYSSQFILSFDDGSCLFPIQNCKSYENMGLCKLMKMSREDFNPIPCGVSKIPKEQLEALVFPNPASDEIHFDISELPVGKEHRISISDAHGRLVMSRIIRGEGNVLTIGISGFKPGIYTYQIYNAESEIVNGKFVKE